MMQSFISFTNLVGNREGTTVKKSNRDKESNSKCYMLPQPLQELLYVLWWELRAPEGLLFADPLVWFFLLHSPASPTPHMLFTKAYLVGWCD